MSTTDVQGSSPLQELLMEDAGFLEDVAHLEEGLAPGFSRAAPVCFAAGHPEAPTRVASKRHVQPAENDGGVEAVEPDPWRVARRIVLTAAFIALMLVGATAASFVFHERFAQVQVLMR